MNKKVRDSASNKNLNKSIVLLTAAMSVFFFAFVFNSPLVMALDAAGEIYRDKNNFFSFRQPADWLKKEITEDTLSHINFTSPDGRANFAVIGQFGDGDLNDLFFRKKEYMEDFNRRFPGSKFSLDWDELAGRQVIKTYLEIPGVLKQVGYYFYDQGIVFDLVYGAGDAEDFQKYEQTALDAFVSVRRQKPG